MASIHVQEDPEPKPKNVFCSFSLCQKLQASLKSLLIPSWQQCGNAQQSWQDKVLAFTRLQMCKSGTALFASPASTCDSLFDLAVGAVSKNISYLIGTYQNYLNVLDHVSRFSSKDSWMENFKAIFFVTDTAPSDVI